MQTNSFLNELGNTIKNKLSQTFAATNSLISSISNYSIDSSIFTGADLESFKEKIAQGMNFDSNDSIFYNNINNVGVEDVFDYFDKNGDGVIDEDEISNISSYDGESENISSTDMMYAFTSMQYDGIVDNLENLFSQNKLTDQATKLYSANPNYSNYTASSSSNVKSSTKQETTQDKLDKIENEEIPELEKQKQEIIDEADANIKKENENLDNLIEENAEILGELGENYKAKQDEINECDNKINEYDSEINKTETEKFQQESTLANLKAELNALDTNTDNEEINAANEQRKSEINSQIQEIEAKIAQLEEKIEENKELKQEQEELKATKQEELNQIEEEIAKQNPELAKQMQEIQEKITSIKSDKETNVTEINSKINAKQIEALECQEKLGKKTGEAQSGPFAQYNAQRGQALAETANELYGNLTSGNSRCAAGVSNAISATFGYTTSGNGCDYGEVLSNLDDWVEVTDMVTGVEDLRNLPAGAIVSWSPYNTSSLGKYYGHVYISDGNGHGISDFKENITDYYISRNSQYRVFLPTDV